MNINERRAWFVYEGTRLAAYAAKAPIIPEPWDLRAEAFRKQFLEVIEKQCGPDRSSDPKKLHDEWMESYTKMTWCPMKNSIRWSRIRTQCSSDFARSRDNVSMTTSRRTAQDRGRQ